MQVLPPAASVAWRRRSSLVLPGRRSWLWVMLATLAAVVVLASCGLVSSLVNTETGLRDAGFQNVHVNLSFTSGSNDVAVDVTVAAVPSETNATQVASIVWQQLHQRFDVLDVVVHGQGPSLTRAYTHDQLQAIFGPRNPAWDKSSLSTSAKSLGTAVVIGLLVFAVVVVAVIVLVVVLVNRRRRRRGPPPGAGGFGGPGGPGWYAGVPGQGYPPGPGYGPPPGPGYGPPPGPGYGPPPGPGYGPPPAGYGPPPGPGYGTPPGYGRPPGPAPVPPAGPPPAGPRPGGPPPAPEAQVPPAGSAPPVGPQGPPATPEPQQRGTTPPEPTPWVSSEGVASGTASPVPEGPDQTDRPEPPA